MSSTRPFVRVLIACVLFCASLGFAQAQLASADNGEAVSRTARSNLSELALSPDGGRVYLVWSDFENAAGEGIGDIYFRYRDGDGWHPALDQAPVSISGSPKVHSEQPTIAVDSNGGVLIVWGEGRPRVLLGRYLPPGADPANGGAWAGPSVVSNENDVQNANLTTDNNGGFWVVYTTLTGDGYDILARRGSAGNWGGSENVSRTGGRGAFVGKVGVDRGGVVSVLWWERGTLRYAARTGGWNAPENVSGSATQQSSITIEPSGRIHVVYTESGPNGDSDRRIGYRTRESWNAPWSAQDFISEVGNMLEPRIAWANGRLVATWNDRTSGPPRIFVMQNFGSGWRDRQAWTSGFRAFSPWIVEGAKNVAYLSFRNADTDQIHFSIYTSSAQPSPTPSPSPSPSPSPNPADRAAPIIDGTTVYFSETGQNLGGVFRDYWLSNGGLTRFGFPLTEEFDETSPDDGRIYKVQYFERARFEYHPENFPPYNVLLGLLGLREHPVDPPAAPILGASYFSETGHNLNGVFRDYWLANGGLAVYGFPTTEEFTEISPTDGKPYTVQYFERNRFEYHPENAGTQYEVLLGLLGRQQLVDRGWLP